MSLDVSLIGKPATVVGTGVFVRQDGQNKELTVEEVRERWPDSDISEQVRETNCLYDANITHNLGEMADKAGIYDALWRPEEKGWKKAKDLIKPLEAGLKKLAEKPGYYKQFNPENGWGDYEGLVEFARKYLIACRQHPEATIEVSR